MTRTRLALLATLAVAFTAPAARAQFDPLHNHLQCYKIRSRMKPAKTVMLNDQFGNSVAAVLTPVLLCLPTQKTCDIAGGCGQDPEPAVPVRHFKCYKVKVPRSPARPAVVLTDQFGTETVQVGAATLLCTPVLKIPVGQTTTTSTSTTTSTTTPFCTLITTGVAPLCGGSCPDPTATCADVPGAGCRCVTPPAPCGGSPVGGVCGGLCTDPALTCQLVGAACQCAPPPQHCGQVQPPLCGGQCGDPSFTCQNRNGGCVCLPPPPCGVAQPPTCGGQCGDPTLTCQPLPSGGACGCF